MSEESSLLFDYPLSDEEKLACIHTMSDFAEYLFGPTQVSESKFNREENLSIDNRYFNLVRRVVKSKLLLESCLDLTLFTPNNSTGFVETTSEDSETIYTQQGWLSEITCVVSEGSISVTHGIGSLIINQIGDIDIDIKSFLDEEHVDPAFIGGQMMLSDQLAITDAFIRVQ